MNAVDYAINRVMSADIDEYLLKLAFDNPNANYAGNWYNLVNQTTVEQGIREKVIHRLVLPACQMNGGKTELLDLSGSKFMNLGNGCIEVNVPDVTTGGRKIISVVEIYLGSMMSSVGSLGMGISDTANCGQGVVNEMLQGMIDGLSGNKMMPVTYTNIQMKGNNCFVIFGMTSGTFSLSAKVLLEYDAGMSSLSTAHYENFAELVEHAVKAYIYRTCRRPTQDAIMRHGVVLDDVKDDIMEFRNSFKDYKEYLENKFIKCMAYSDRMRVNDSIRAATPRRM